MVTKVNNIHSIVEEKGKLSKVERCRYIWWDSKSEFLYFWRPRLKGRIKMDNPTKLDYSFDGVLDLVVCEVNNGNRTNSVCNHTSQS